MNVFLAATSTTVTKKELAGFLNRHKPIFVLESFYYVNELIMNYIFTVDCKSFMLDSGAFTFMKSLKKNGTKVDFLKYTHDYCDFINKYDVKHFFEMDIDSLTSLEYAEKLRTVIERETGKKPIPVWHVNRGKQYFIDMCKAYDYVAVGGINFQIQRKDYQYFNWFCDIAHQHGCKIHGLGFTPPKNANSYRFDSVDSSTWNAGVRYGQLHYFTGNSIETITPPKGMRGKREPLKHQNFQAWVEYQKYLNGEYT